MDKNITIAVWIPSNILFTVVYESGAQTIPFNKVCSSFQRYANAICNQSGQHRSLSYFRFHLLSSFPEYRSTPVVDSCFVFVTCGIDCHRKVVLTAVRNLLRKPFKVFTTQTHGLGRNSLNLRIHTEPFFVMNDYMLFARGQGKRFFMIYCIRILDKFPLIQRSKHKPCWTFTPNKVLGSSVTAQIAGAPFDFDHLLFASS